MSSITSNDNASYYQGYLGYPIVATLMHVGKLDYDRNVATQLSGVHWKQINQKHKNKYEKAIEEVLQTLAKKGVDVSLINAEVDRIYESLSKMSFGMLSRRRKPPLSKKA